MGGQEGREDDWFRAERAEADRRGAGRPGEAGEGAGGAGAGAESATAASELHFMKCPKCGHDMKEEDLHGVKADRCTFCEGMFFDAGELDAGAAQEGRGSQGLLPPARRRSEPPAAPAVMPYLIDGNNLLGSWGGPRGEDDRRARSCGAWPRSAARAGVRATVVFDGHPLRPDMAAQELGPVVLRVPPPGQDADTVIRELVERAPRARGTRRRDLRQGALFVREDAGRDGAARARVERAGAPDPRPRAPRAKAPRSPSARTTSRAG